LVVCNVCKGSNRPNEKLEGNNPAGSVRRLCLTAMIMRAEHVAISQPGVLIEATSGNKQALHLAMVAASVVYKND